jgi:hypothetical protein
MSRQAIRGATGKLWGSEAVLEISGLKPTDRSRWDVPARVAASNAARAPARRLFEQVAPEEQSWCETDLAALAEPLAR